MASTYHGPMWHGSWHQTSCWPSQTGQLWLLCAPWFLSLRKREKHLTPLMAQENYFFFLNLREEVSFPWTASSWKNFYSNYSDTCWCPSSPPWQQLTLQGWTAEGNKPQNNVVQEKQYTHQKAGEHSSKCVISLASQGSACLFAFSFYVLMFSLVGHMLNLSWLSWDFYYAVSPVELRKGKGKKKKQLHMARTVL